VFGRLLAGIFGRFRETAAEEFRVVEWGAGRGELGEYLAGAGYAAIDVNRDDAPSTFSGVAFSNELFDALPVEVARRIDGEWQLMRVALEGARFVWAAGEKLEGEWRDYAERCGAAIEREDAWLELPVRIAPMIEAIDGRLRRGRVVAIDYGYTERELRRFPGGTLMSYQRHRALDEVLDAPGERDITAHVPFDHLLRCAGRRGWQDASLKTLARWLVDEGESGAIEEAIRGDSDEESSRRRLQLKTLLFGMGESFRVASWKKGL